MPVAAALHPAVKGVVAELLNPATDRLAGVVLEGEAGIGKTTALRVAEADANGRGFTVLSATASPAESVLAHTTLADLLAPIDPAVFSTLPEPQRNALNWVLLRAGTNGFPTDQRAVSAAFVTVLNQLATTSPVLVAIDDLQWLDPSSAQVIDYATRRLPEQIKVLGAVRTDGGTSPATWLRLRTPEHLRRVTVPPLQPGDLYAVIVDRLGLALSRPTLMRIHEVSGGNPFYALELVRALGTAPESHIDLPESLTELVRERIGKLDPAVEQVLLTTACATRPTISLLSRATGVEPETIVAGLEGPEERDVVNIDGDQVRFVHPLLSQGVHNSASAAQRRAVHRQLANAVDEPELRARHLALAATGRDIAAVEALDTAAASARNRGAPAAAAELTELALRLGGDTPQRRIRLAADHFDAGEPARARAVLEDTISQLPRGPLRAEAYNLLGMVWLFDDSFAESIELLQHALEVEDPDTAVRGQMLLNLSLAQYNLGQLENAAIVSADEAIAVARRLGVPEFTSLALGMRVILGFLVGEGFDEDTMSRALELEGDNLAAPVAVQPTLQNALLLGWTGRLDLAHTQLSSIRRGCVDRGDEFGLVFAIFQSVLVDCWRGDFAEAALLTAEATERAQQLGGSVPLLLAKTMRAMLAVRDGREQDARSDVEAALAASKRCGSKTLATAAIAALGHLEVSLGRYPEALSALDPLLDVVLADRRVTEIIPGLFLPDVIEAMIAVGRLPDAQTRIEQLEHDGTRFNRAWAKAVGARGRSMLAAASGDLPAAVEAAQHALREHESLPMPFERARTMLFLGQVLRRQRHKEAGAAMINEAIRVFDELGTRLWSDKARAELDRANVGPHRHTALTPSEQRVAELAASGMTNREVAAALFISPKTVEANLARIYRKFGIRTRAQLGQRMAQPADHPDAIGKHPI